MNISNKVFYCCMGMALVLIVLTVCFFGSFIVHAEIQPESKVYFPLIHNNKNRWEKLCVVYYDGNWYRGWITQEEHETLCVVPTPKSTWTPIPATPRPTPTLAPTQRVNP